MRDPNTPLPASLVSAVIVRDGKIALVAAEQDRWRSVPGYTLVPVELPGGTRNVGEPPEEAVARLCAHFLGASARTLSSRHIFGPSPTHRVDRLAKEIGPPPYPLLRFERAEFVSPEHGEERTSLVVRAFLAAIEDTPSFNECVSGVLWSTPDMMLTLARGLPFEDIIQLPRGIEWLPNPTYSLPDDAFFYMPAEYGERHIVRIVAKYGRGILDGEDIKHGT